MIALGIAAYVLVGKAMFWGGLYDTWVPGGGDVRLVTNPTLDPRIIFGYVFSPITGGKGNIVAVDNLEDLVGGHIWVGGLLISFSKFR